MTDSLDTITVAIDDQPVTYFVAQTTAPKAYDGFGTINVFETYGDTGNERNVRIVLIREEHFNWQNGRYNSGLYYATHYDKENIAQELWKRLAGQSEIVADAVRAEDKAKAAAERDAKLAAARAALPTPIPPSRDWHILRQAEGKFGIWKSGHRSASTVSKHRERQG
jgi:hypothetical protein